MAFSDPAADIAAMINVQGELAIDPSVFPTATLAPEPEAEPVPEPTPEPVPDPEPVPEVDPAPAEPTPEPAGDDDNVVLPDGSTFSLARLRELAQLDHAFRTNPVVAQEVTEAVQRRGMFQPGTGPSAAAPPVAPSTPPGVQLPADVDPDDPIVKYVTAQNAALDQRFAQIQNTLQAQQSASAVSGLTRAREDMVKKYPHLTFDDLAAIEVTAGARGYGTHFLNQYGDPYKAALDAMETAAAVMPEMRPKILAAPPAGVTPISKEQRVKQQTLNALAGKGGSAPRTEPAPRKLTNAEKIAAMADEIGKATQAN